MATLVRCTRGAIVSVAVDVRPDSDSYGKHVMIQLSADNRRALFLPPYVAHGFQTLADNTEVLYQVSDVYEAAEEQGFRWNEPEFAIDWPLAVSVISQKDANWPLLASVKDMTLLAARNVATDGSEGRRRLRPMTRAHRRSHSRRGTSEKPGQHDSPTLSTRPSRIGRPPAVTRPA